MTRDQLDSIDFTDNSISSLANFPLLRRLQHLYLSNNPLRTISISVPTSLPNLRTLILTNCQIPKDSLPALAIILGNFKKLETLSMRGCPIQETQYYREWIVFNCKKLRSLDFDRIKDKVCLSPLPHHQCLLTMMLQDRDAAKALFLAPDNTPTPLALSFTTPSANGNGLAKTFEPGLEPEKGVAARLLSKEEKDRVRKAIEGATTVEEVRSSPLSSPTSHIDADYRSDVSQECSHKVSYPRRKIYEIWKRRKINFTEVEFVCGCFCAI